MLRRKNETEMGEYQITSKQYRMEGKQAVHRLFGGGEGGGSGLKIKIKPVESNQETRSAHHRSAGWKRKKSDHTSNFTSVHRPGSADLVQKLQHSEDSHEASGTTIHRWQRSVFKKFESVNTSDSHFIRGRGIRLRLWITYWENRTDTESKWWIPSLAALLLDEEDACSKVQKNWRKLHEQSDSGVQHVHCRRIR